MDATAPSATTASRGREGAHGGAHSPVDAWLRGPEPVVFAGSPWRRWAVPLGVLVVLAVAGIWMWLVAAGLDPAGLAGPELIRRIPLSSLHRAREALRA